MSKEKVVELGNLRSGSSTLLRAFNSFGDEKNRPGYVTISSEGRVGRLDCIVF